MTPLSMGGVISMTVNDGKTEGRHFKLCLAHMSFRGGNDGMTPLSLP
jgi:hypothetical protein